MELLCGCTACRSRGVLEAQWCEKVLLDQYIRYPHVELEEAESASLPATVEERMRETDLSDL